MSEKGKLHFRFRVPRLRRGQSETIYALDTTIAGSLLAVSPRRREPNLTVTPRGVHGTLTPCEIG